MHLLTIVINPLTFTLRLGGPKRLSRLEQYLIA